jgi:GNAT superfamily N-acetyltransferase
LSVSASVPMEAHSAAPAEYTMEALAARHVPELCDLHLGTWGAFEISVRLGRGYVRRFYETLAGSTTSFGYVAMRDGRIAGYATGFRDYPRFFDELLSGYRLRFYATVLARVLTGRLRPRDLAQARQAGKLEHGLRNVRYHQNGLALHPDLRGTPLGREIIMTLIRRVLDDLRASGAPGCWGRTDARNQPMRAYYRKLGFTEVALPGAHDARYVYFELEWS